MLHIETKQTKTFLRNSYDESAKHSHTARMWAICPQSGDDECFCLWLSVVELAGPLQGTEEADKE